MKLIDRLNNKLRLVEGAEDQLDNAYADQAQRDADAAYEKQLDASGGRTIADDWQLESLAIKTAEQIVFMPQLEYEHAKKIIFDALQEAVRLSKS